MKVAKLIFKNKPIKLKNLIFQRKLTTPLINMDMYKLQLDPNIVNLLRYDDEEDLKINVAEPDYVEKIF